MEDLTSRTCVPCHGGVPRVRGRELEAFARQVPGWEVVAPHPLSLVCFRYAPDRASEEERNSLNERIMAHVNATGEAFLSHTKLGGVFTLRLAVGNIRTTARHVERAWELLNEKLSEITSDGRG